MQIELNAKCESCGYTQVLKGFEKILRANKNKKMNVLYTDFLLMNEKSCYNCGGG